MPGKKGQMLRQNTEKNSEAVQNVATKVDKVGANPQKNSESAMNVVQ
jgi:hypothetical protein